MRRALLLLPFLVMSSVSAGEITSRITDSVQLTVDGPTVQSTRVGSTYNVSGSNISVTTLGGLTSPHGSGAAAVVPPKKKPYVPASKKPKQGNIGRTTTKYDTPKGKAKVAAKPKAVAKPKAAPKKKPATKKKVSRSGMGMKAYQNLNSNRRK